MSDRSLVAEVARLKRQVEQLAKGQRYAHGGSIENAAIQVNDDTGTLRATVGIQPDGTAGVVAVNGPPPPAPSAPILTPSISGLRVTWDGTLNGGSELPADFDHIAVYVSGVSGFEPSTATFAGTITKAGDGGMLPITPLPYIEHYVRFVGVNTSGIGGAPSTETAGTPVQVDGPDLTAGSVTAGTIAAGAVTADKLEAILQLATRIVAGDPAGARVELNADGLKAYNTSGALTVNINAATGAASLTGDITGSTFTGGTITGATVQTAASGSRVTLDTKMKLYNASNQLLAEATPAGGITNDAGFICYNTTGLGRYYAMLSRGYLLYGKEGVSYAGLPGIDHLVVSGNNSALRLYSGSIGTGSGVQSSIYMGGSADGGVTPAHVDIASDASNARCDLKVTGVVTAGNVATGTVNITPSAASTPTSMLVNFSVIGTNPRGYATAVTTVPGVRTPTGNAGVTGVSVSSVTNSSMLVWVNRENTTTTTINWRVEASL